MLKFEFPSKLLGYGVQIYANLWYNMLTPDFSDIFYVDRTQLVDAKTSMRASLIAMQNDITAVRIRLFALQWRAKV